MRTDIEGTNNGNGVGFQALFTRTDGSTGIAQTIYFATSPRETLDPTPPGFTLAEGVEGLPTLPRSGELLNLQYVLSNNAQLLTDWTALTGNAAGLSPAALEAQFQALLLRWAGVEGTDAASRGEFVDGRHLAFVEAFFGEQYREISGGAEVRTFPRKTAEGARVQQGGQGEHRAFATAA